MNKTKIEWCDMTWNPVTGCRRGCDYCYARRIAERFGKVKWPTNEIHTLDQMQTRMTKSGKETASPFPFGFEPTLHSYRLNEPMKEEKGQNIFVCSMADLFGPWVPDTWIKLVLDACEMAPQHRYLFLTKFPERYLALDKVSFLPHGDNFWYGSTATNPMTDPMLYSDSFNTFVSIEPLLGPFGTPDTGALDFIGGFIIGAETGNRKGKVVPEREWVKEIVEYCDAAGKPVFMKDSLIPIVDESLWRRELPW